MKTERLTLRIDPRIRARVRRKAKETGVTESDFVREAIEKHSQEEPAGPTVYDLLNRLGAIGISDRGPKDLSTNKKYMEGFGRSRR